QDAASTGSTSAALDAEAARIRAIAAEWPQPVRAWFVDLVDRGGGHHGAEAARQLHVEIDGDAGALCRQAIEGRYPFAGDAIRDVPLGDFATLFGPGGVLDRLTRQRLDPIVETTAPTWKARRGAIGGERLSPDTLASFQRAADVRAAFFASSPSPAATADLAL